MLATSPEQELACWDWESSLREGGLLGDLRPQFATSNVDASRLPFQRWYRFKEAFAPAFVAEAFAGLSSKPRTCLDPFGGSGTTSVTGQRLGIRPTTIEVNPFLADLIEAKLTSYRPEQVRSCWHEVLRLVSQNPVGSWPAELPATFVEPGVGGRWIFDAGIAARIASYRAAIDQLSDASVSRLFRILLGSALITASNVVISGKGRRYRGGATCVRPSVAGLDQLLDDGFAAIYSDIVGYGARPEPGYSVIRGDARERLDDVSCVDVVLFSPPYPNSFDYTDIYNVELWALGYLTSRAENRSLREATLRSHVQIVRSFESELPRSPTFERAYEQLGLVRGRLWSRHIPEMLRAYFGDLSLVLTKCKDRLTPGGHILLVVGDSKYAGVRIDVAGVIAEITPELGLRQIRSMPVRSMRSSAQQGGDFQLTESLVDLVAV